MSLETVLKNIYGYVDVLQTACSEGIQQWDHTALSNAFQWAKYCQKVYTQAQGKPYAPDLGEHVKRIGQLPWAVGDIEISLPALEHAECYLKKALLQNPHLPDNLFSELLCTYGDVKHSPTQLVEDILDLSHFNQASQVASLCMSLNSQSSLDTIVEPSDIHTTTAAECLLIHASKLLGCKPERRQQCEEMLVGKLEKLAGEQQMAVLAKCCSLPTVSSQNKMAQHFIITWLIDSPYLEKMFFLPGPALADICLVHFTFYQKYLHHLIKCTEKAEKYFDQEGVATFRLLANMEYTELLSRLQVLISTKDPVSSATFKTVETLHHNDSVGLWRKTFLQLLKE